MSSPDSVRVFFNGRGVDAPHGASVLDAARLWDVNEAGAIERGERALADSRGLPADPASPVYGGAIFRLVSARQREGGSND